MRRCGPDAVADRHSALALRGVLSSFPTRPQVLLPHEARVRRVTDLRLDTRRTRRLLSSHLDDTDGIPCVSAARAIANLAADWLILQLTPTILHEQWPAFLAQLRRCLVRRAAPLGVPAPPGTAEV